MVHLHHAVRKVADTAAAGELGMRQGGKVQVRERHVQEERLPGACLALQEGDGMRDQFRIDQAARLNVIHLHVLRWRTAFPLHDHGDGGNTGIETWRFHMPGLMRGTRDAIPLVESTCVGQALLQVTQMPLAEHGGRVPLGLEQLGQQHFPSCHAVRHTRRLRLNTSGTNGVPACHQGTSGGDAIALDVEVLQQQALRRQRVDTRRGRTAQRAATVTAQLAPPEVVRQHQHDICHERFLAWLLRLHVHCSEIFRSRTIFSC